MTHNAHPQPVADDQSYARAAGLQPPQSKIQNPKSKILSVRNLHKTYRLGRVDVPVLRGVDMDVRHGEWVAVLGASGCGKSTLLHLLGDLDSPDANGGTIQFDGRDLAALSLHERNRYRNGAVGFVFQFYHLLPELTVLENTLLHALVRPTLKPPRYWVAITGGLAIAGAAAALGLGLWLVEGAAWWMLLLLAFGGAATMGLVGLAVFNEVRSALLRFGGEYRTLRADAAKLLESFGLGHRLRHRPRELSGGERQRVAIARALMTQPQVLLADEPTGNLDEKTGAEILDLIAAQHQRGLTIVMVTHDEAIARRADRIVRLHGGRVE